MVEGIMRSDRELRRAYEVYVDEQEIINLVSLQVVRDRESNTRLAELIYQDVMRILDGHPNKSYTMLVNLLSVGKDGYASSKARKIYLQMSSHDRVTKFAIVGGSVFARTMAGFIIRAAGKDQAMRWLPSRKEAVVWLKEGVRDG
jgi:hypothetical protein